MRTLCETHRRFCREAHGDAPGSTPRTASVAPTAWRPASAVSALALVASIGGPPGLGAQVRGDFDGDGYADLAIGVVGEDVDGVLGAGAVNVLYGSAGNLTAAGDQLWHQNSDGVRGLAHVQDFFGAALAVGDFDGDGFSDLAVGVVREDVDGVIDAGAVNVLHGSSSGLSAAGDQLWHQNSDGVRGLAEEYDFFGSALSAGDYDGDGFDDLAVGVPGESVDGQESAGAVNILYGSASGLTAAGDQLWHQNSELIVSTAEEWEAFGSALASGDFDGDGYEDLAVAVPAEDGGLFLGKGAAHVLYGSAAGIASPRDKLWSQDTPGILDDSESLEGFAASLAVGDFDGDGYADLAIGVPGETVDGVLYTGAVNVLYGSVGLGLTSNGDQFWHQGSSGIRGKPEVFDKFGEALAAGDFDGDGRDDLAVGVRHESVDGVASAGAVNVIYGGAGGLQAAGDQLWHQNVSGVLDFAEEEDFFGGQALSTGDFDGNGYADLAVGVSGEDSGGVEDAGAVHVFYGSGGGLTEILDQMWSQVSPGVKGAAEEDDAFGNAVSGGS